MNKHAARPPRAKARRLGLAALLTTLLLGCAHREAPPPPPPDPLVPALTLSPDPLTRANEEAADRLVLHARAAGLDGRSTILVASVVALDDIKTSSPLGRLVAEQVAGRLAQHGLGIKDVRLREALVVRPDQGELLLSREATELARQHQAQAALIGGYTRSREATRLSLRLVRLDDARVLAAANYAVAVDERSDAILAPEPPPAGTLYDAVLDYSRRLPPLKP